MQFWLGHWRHNSPLPFGYGSAERGLRFYLLKSGPHVLNSIDARHCGRLDLQSYLKGCRSNLSSGCCFPAFIREVSSLIVTIYEIPIFVSKIDEQESTAKRVVLC